MADNAVAKMVLEQPGLQAALGAAAGAIAFEWSASGIPIVGKRGVGVLMESSGSERTPVIITQLEINGAQGLGSYIGVLTIKDSESFQRAKTERLSMENAGTIYIYVKGEASASYAVKRITIEPQSR